MNVFAGSYPREYDHKKSLFSLSIPRHTFLHPFISAATQSVLCAAPENSSEVFLDGFLDIPHPDNDLRVHQRPGLP